MKNLNDVNLLIFDLDGTILQSEDANLDAMNKAFLRMNLNIPLNIDDVKVFLGGSSDDFYKKILPPEKIPYLDKIREKVRDEYYTSFLKFGKLYPDVLKTLDILKKRKYKMAICSNCSVKYLKAVLSVFKIKKFFDCIECTQKYQSTKTELVKKIIKSLGFPKAAFVGDRSVDIAAARENKVPSIGALYGYGCGEAGGADITIDRFSDLAKIFDRKIPIFDKMLEEIAGRKQKDRPFVVGISGIDASGKTDFAKSFEHFLTSRNYKMQMILLDDFHNPKKIRYSGKDEIDSYYNKSFNLALIINRLLNPISRGKDFSIKLKLLDLYTDRFEAERKYFIDRDTVVIFEGVFLFRKELSSYIDYKVFLEIPLKESMHRARNRDTKIFGKEILKKYKSKYMPAQKMYFNQYPPYKVADMVIDNLNWEFPVIKKCGKL